MTTLMAYVSTGLLHNIINLAHYDNFTIHDYTVSGSSATETCFLLQ